MIKIKKILLTYIILLFVLSACNLSKSTEGDQYNGHSLNIGIIGELPKSNSDRVKFHSMTFTDLHNDSDLSSTYDAIFITKDNFNEASQSEYARIYKNAKLPFFFIESKKSYIPFIYEDVSYKDAPVIDDQMYITGIFIKNEQIDFWGFGLLNNQMTDKNINNAFERVFSTINKLKVN